MAAKEKPAEDVKAVIGPLTKSMEASSKAMTSMVAGIASVKTGMQATMKGIGATGKAIKGLPDNIKSMTASVKAMPGNIKEGALQMAQTTKEIGAEVAKVGTEFKGGLDKSLREQAKVAMGGSKNIQEAFTKIRDDLVAQGVDMKQASTAAAYEMQDKQAAMLEQLKASPIAMAKATLNGIGPAIKSIPGVFGKVMEKIKGEPDAGDKEKSNEESRFRKGFMGVLGKIDAGIMGVGGALKKVGGAAKGGIKSLKGLLGKTALALAIPALMAFMQSPYFGKLADFIRNDLIPGIKNIWEKIEPVAIAIATWVKESALPIIMNMLIENFRALTQFFSDIFARFEGWSDMSLREKIGAVLGIFTDITALLGKMIGNMIEAVLNLFGADGSTLRKKYWDPIAKFFTDMVDAVLLIFTDPVAGIKKLFATLWSGAKGIGGFIFDITVKPLWNWIKGIFGFSEKKKHPDEPASDDNTLWGWIKGIPGKIWSWIKSIFGFSSGAEEDPKAEVGETKGFFSKVLHAIIPAGIFTFLEDPILWFWTNILGIPKKDGKKPSAAEAAEAIATGKADGIFAAVMGAILPQGVIEFILDPIDWIFVNVLKLGNKDGVKESTTQKAGMILGTAVGIFEKVLKAILPDGLVDMIMSPINWLFEKVLGIKPNAVLDTVSEAHGVTKGDTTGLWQSMLDAILPAGLARFLGDPIGYIFTDILKLGKKGEKTPESTAEKAGIIAGTVVGMFESILKAILPDGLVDFVLSPLKWFMKTILKIDVGQTMESVKEAHGIEGTGDASGLFKSILSAILPAGLVDFIMSPWSWFKTKFGWGDTSTETMDLVDDKGKPIAVGKTDGIFTKILKAILPDGLVDFLMSPIDWILNKLGLGKNKKPEDISGLVPTEIEMPNFGKVIGNLLGGIFPDKWILGEGWIGGAVNAIMPQSLIDVLKEAKGLAAGGMAKAGDFAVVGEQGPELIKFGKAAVVASNEQMMAGRDFAMNAMRAATTGSPGAAGGGGTVVNNTSVVAPMSQTSSAVAVSVPIGASDPYTNATRAY